MTVIFAQIEFRFGVRPADVMAKNISNKFYEILKIDLNLTSELENVAQGHVSSIYAAIELKYGMRPAGIKLQTISNKFFKLLKLCLNLTSELHFSAVCIKLHL